MELFLITVIFIGGSGDVSVSIVSFKEMVIIADASVLCVLVTYFFPSVPSLIWAQDSCLCDRVIHHATELIQLPVTLKLEKNPNPSPLLDNHMPCFPA